MISPPSNERRLKVLVGEQLQVHLDTPSIRRAVVAAAYALLTPEQLTDVVADRAVIEQAKGMLMMSYNIDAEQAFDLLKSRSAATNIRLRTLARYVTEEFPTLSADHRVL